MDYEAITAVRDRQPAWRLLRAGNATLILSFLREFFVEGNRGACSASTVADALHDHLYALNTDEDRYPKQLRDAWAAAWMFLYINGFELDGDFDVDYARTS